MRKRPKPTVDNLPELCKVADSPFEVTLEAFKDEPYSFLIQGGQTLSGYIAVEEYTAKQISITFSRAANRIEALEQRVAELEKFADAVAGDPSYEIDCQGIYASFCFYCDAYLSEGAPHAEECLHILAKNCTPPQEQKPCKKS
jgi:hypothetical protein